MKAKTPTEIASMRQAGQIVGSLLYDLAQMVAPGVTPRELDDASRQLIKGRGGELAFLGYNGFPAAVCISVNDVVVHGIPGDKAFAPGDIVGVDAGAKVDGLYADAAVTVPVGKISDEAQRLLAVTKQALEAGIARVAPGKQLGDVQAAIQAVVEQAGFGIIRDLVGHGIGYDLHEEPEIPNYGRAGTGVILQEGMTFCLEPMVTVGKPDVTLDSKDGWTIRTKDGSLGAQFEHTILVNADGAEILTPIRPWPKIE